MIEFDDSTDGDVWRQFEAAWKRGKRPCLWEAIAAVNPACRIDLAAEFAMIELEWRWRLDINNEPRTAAHFAQLLSPLNLQSQHFVSMIEHEFIVRSQWGDAPTVDQMLNGLPAQSELRKIFQVALNENFPINGRLKINEAAEQIFSLNIRTSFKLSPATESSEAIIDEDGLTTTCILPSASTDSESDVLVDLQRLSIHRVIAVVRLPSPACMLDAQPLAPNTETWLDLSSELQINDRILKFHRHF